MDEAAYRAKLTAEGFGEPTLREQPADKFVDRHTHDFAACLLFLEGEFTVATDDTTTTCHAGDVFELAPNIPHTERSGPAGAKYWAATKPV